jgi:copper chaperone CopZ
MQSYVFNLKSEIGNSKYCQILEDVIREINGVHYAYIFRANQEILITYDDKLVSASDIGSFLKMAGYAVEIQHLKPKYTEEVCCGSCGS